MLAILLPPAAGGRKTHTSLSMKLRAYRLDGIPFAEVACHAAPIAKDPTGSVPTLSWALPFIKNRKGVPIGRIGHMDAYIEVGMLLVVGIALIFLLMHSLTRVG